MAVNLSLVWALKAASSAKRLLAACHSVKTKAKSERMIVKVTASTVHSRRTKSAFLNPLGGFRPLRALSIADLISSLIHASFWELKDISFSSSTRGTQNMVHSNHAAFEGASTVPGASRQGSAVGCLSQQLPSGLEPTLQTAD